MNQDHLPRGGTHSVLGPRTLIGNYENVPHRLIRYLRFPLPRSLRFIWDWQESLRTGWKKRQDKTKQNSKPYSMLNTHFFLKTVLFSCCFFLTKYSTFCLSPLLHVVFSTVSIPLVHIGFCCVHLPPVRISFFTVPISLLGTHWFLYHLTLTGINLDSYSLCRWTWLFILK